ncbi:hypothetical protein V2S66_00960 [Streptomyces sp. V4-01]|uniref:Lipoprotein n=1 Tax=Actinacidiphila polyblastidii TaxID=3110430 RepID=A0ABU7P433_9ACTN|nr:hypothetical protein [Streptomyces sp. V4-01]
MVQTNRLSGSPPGAQGSAGARTPRRPAAGGPAARYHLPVLSLRPFLPTAAICTAALTVLTALTGCGSSGPAAAPGSSAPAVTTSGVPAAGAGPAIGTAVAIPSPSAHSGRPSAGASATPRPPAPARLHAGNPQGHEPVPAAGRAADTSHPTRVVGHGSPAGCTSAAVVAAVAAGGVITFSCGPRPVVIVLAATAKVRNASARVVLDGGGLVTLSGGGRRRILYMDTCDQAQGWTTSHCQDQSSPELTVQNLTFADGDATGEKTDGGGGGAVFVRGGRFKAVNTRFVRNRCDATGPDLGGAAIRVLDQYHGLPVYVTGSTFGGAPGQGGVCSNGGALSSIGVSWVITNSLFGYNSAIGSGANPARGGTPGGGSGGAVYTDGNRYTVRISGSLLTHNDAREGGGALFYVSNDRTGTLTLTRTTARANPSHGFETAGFPGVFFLGAGHPLTDGSTLN